MMKGINNGVMETVKEISCPFCGNQAAIDTLNHANGRPVAYRVQCPNCGAATRWCTTEAEARTAWRIRAKNREAKRYKPWQRWVYL
jgi:sarcosine oxidase delta subunit